MELTGHNFIGNTLSGNGETKFHAVDPVTGTELPTAFHEATMDEVDAAVRKAERAFQQYSRLSGKGRAMFLEAIAQEILDLGDGLIRRCCEETGLPQGRIVNERGRTVHQLKLFADVLKEGSWVDARIDTGDPKRTPAPKPDIRSMQKPLGPVGVFGASNFPLAFSVAGGDTASALAAGCPVVVKAHPAHPGTCEMIARAIVSAQEKTTMPDGVFSMVHGMSVDVGMAIVRHPAVKAVGFTGSYAGGKALYDAAVRRDEPIPVYAEMGSSNPVFILPGAMRQWGEEIAKGLTNSVTLGVGQFCTNPGLTFYQESGSEQGFQKKLSDSFSQTQSGTMLTQGIYKHYADMIGAVSEYPGVQVIATGTASAGNAQGVPSLLQISFEQFLQDKNFEKEIFGPSTIGVTMKEKSHYIIAAQQMKGHLTATLWGTESDLEEYKELIEILGQKVGRVIINGFPTGVEVTHAMVHGGTFPATTDSRMTSVGTAAIYRFTRPVCYQGFSDALLPDELKNQNPLTIWRLVDGVRVNTPIRES